MAWLMVICAGLLETGFAVCLKKSESFSRLLPTLGFAVFALGSFGLLTLALRRLEVGPAYAVWTGIGAAGTVIYGMVFLNEAVTAPKILAVVLIVAGVAVLNLAGAGH
jgi:quaternary ammonium compound-resistance protein SugE